MSGTRSPSRKEPATDALIVAHGQPSDPQAGEISIARLAAAVQALTPGRHVRGVTLAAEGALERAVMQAREGALVYPMFMAGGWFVTHELPRRLGNPDLRVLPPLGLSPELPMMAVRTIRTRLAARHWKAGKTHVVVAAHGSGRSPHPAEAALEFAGAMSQRLRGVKVTTGFIEEAPSLNDAARDLPVTAFCLPFFASDGQHVYEDIPAALTAGGFRGELLQPIGLHREVPGLIAATLSLANAPQDAS